MEKLPLNIAASSILAVDIALGYGLLPKHELIEWSDKMITASESPDPFFLELSMLGSKKITDISSYLNSAANASNINVPGKPVLGFFYRKFSSGQSDLLKTIQLLFELKNELHFTKEEQDFIYLADHNYEIADYYNNQTKLEQAKKDLLQLLSIYKNYSLNNITEWGKMQEENDEGVNTYHRQYFEKQQGIGNTVNTDFLKKKSWKFWK